MRAASRPLLDEAFDIKGTVASLTVLRLRTAELSRLEADLAARVAPQDFLAGAPVVLDVSQLEADPPWPELLKAVRAAGVVPIAATGARGDSGLPPLQLGSRLRAVDSDLPVPPAPAPAPEPDPSPRPLTIHTPVRGGQVTYARNTDLVIIASVNPGAQVLSDHSVHVWGPLRGRALAGAQGRKDARILCLSLEAELVSVAGEYVMADEIPDALRGKPAQVFLDVDRVRIAPL